MNGRREEGRGKSKGTLKEITGKLQRFSKTFFCDVSNIELVVLVISKFRVEQKVIDRGSIVQSDRQRKAGSAPAGKLKIRLCSLAIDVDTECGSSGWRIGKETRNTFDGRSWMCVEVRVIRLGSSEVFASVVTRWRPVSSVNRQDGDDSAVGVVCCGQKPINLGGVKKRDVYIAGFFPYGSHVPECHVGRGVMPSVKLAVDHINEDPTVLRNYRLHMWWNDTEVIPPKDMQYPDTGWCFILTNNYICHLVGAVPC
uniref:Uncharacterized protein n=1 Tax=Vespula pensylvanica TaxID=30213 RepID=A0A834P270_VESPE|nr:hypothetical protein H0235_007899 [Vespula pensylvanica]